jgi:hypothetical protein
MSQIVLVICSGFHPRSYTAQILTVIAMDPLLSQVPVITANTSSPLAPLSGQVLRQTIEQSLPAAAVTYSARQAWPELIIWAFSAGCLGATSLAHYWQRYRAPVRALFWVDGWGIPWGGVAPLHRLSHDGITHITTGCLGRQKTSFVATPAVSHLRLWQSPQTVLGQHLGDASALGTANLAQSSQDLSAAKFLCGWTRHYMTEGNLLDR